MEYSILFKFFTVIAACIVICKGNPLPHIIGGGFGDDFTIADDSNESQAPTWLVSALSNLKMARLAFSSESTNAGGHHNVFEVISTESEPASPVLIHRHDDPQGIQLPGMEPHANSAHPFLRAKRQTNEECQITEDLPEMVRDLNSHLNSSQFVGLSPESQAQEPSQDYQEYSQCPAATGSWWGQQTDLNLRSTCPWVYNNTDLGADHYPRFLRTAKCVCQKCIGSENRGCEELRQDVTVLVRKGCKDGVALFEQEKHTITVGCTCITSAPSSDTATPPPVGAPGGPPALQ